MAVREADVGIVAFADALPGFRAILKHTWRDFHVNEVGLDGAVLTLTSLAPPAPALTRPEETVVATEEQDSIESVVEAFRELVGEEGAAKLRTLAVASGQEDVEAIEIGPIPEKEKRKDVHMFCKRQLPGFPPLASEALKREGTDATFVRIAPLSKAKKMRDWKNRSRERGQRNKSAQNCIRNEGLRRLWDADGGCCRYVHFALYKENTDNQVALNLLARGLHVPPTAFRIAGTKDKRGVTTQWVAAQGVNVEALARLNSKLKHIKVGNFRPSNENLFVGDLQGNQFHIALRDVQEASLEQIREACDSLKENGFVNYFGLQRFGQGTPTHVVGRALLKGDWKEAARLILQPCSADDQGTAAAKQRYLAGDINGALELLPRKAVSEQALLQGYSELGPEQHLSSILRIGRNIRTLYAHAYQSYVWNCVVTERIARHGPRKVLEGDLVLVEDPAAAGQKRTTTGDRSASVRHVSSDDIAADRFSVSDVVLPLPGGSVSYPENEMKQLYQEIAAQDGISLTDSVHRVKEFSLGKLAGDYRKVIGRAEDLQYETVRYRKPYEPLLQSDLDQLRASDHSPDGDCSRKRKLVEAAEESQTKRPRIDGLTEKLALRLRFCLGSSSYATMAVRQLTKYSTSKADQAALSKTEQTENTSSEEDS